MGDHEGSRAAGGPPPLRVTAHEHAELLRERLEALALEIAASEDSVAEVYEDSARLRPHAAERLRAAAREARAYAERERQYRAPRGTRGDAQPDQP
jgi:hypothetical protein